MPHTKKTPEPTRPGHWPLPWPLAWHPRTAGDTPDPARFVPPYCHPSRHGISGGLWTSPMLSMNYSCWSIWADQEGRGRWWRLRQGWAIGWPDPARTVTVSSLADLQAVVGRYPCRAHASTEDLWRVCWAPRPDAPRPDADGNVAVHDDRSWPPIDFAAMGADFDALHVTAQGLSETFLTRPGTTTWSAETVLWINPVFEVLDKIRTRRWRGTIDFL